LQRKVKTTRPANPRAGTGVEDTARGSVPWWTADADISRDIGKEKP